jgi:hypothetical protein
MNKLFKFMTIAAVGVAIGSVATRIVRSEKLKVQRKSLPATDQNNQQEPENRKKSNGKDPDDLENCFI